MMLYSDIQEKTVIKIQGTLEKEKYVVLVRKENDIWCCPYGKLYSSIIKISLNPECSICKDTNEISEEQHLLSLGYYFSVRINDYSNETKDKKWYFLEFSIKNKFDFSNSIV